MSASPDNWKRAQRRRWDVKARANWDWIDERGFFIGMRPQLALIRCRPDPASAVEKLLRPKAEVKAEVKAEPAQLDLFD
jgi:hypothetical protein